MNRKEAYEHLRSVERAIKEFKYDCMDEFDEIYSRYMERKYNRNQDLYEDTSRMMCNARHRVLG